MYDILKKTKLRCESVMEKHDRASYDQRLQGYSGVGVTDMLDPNWNRPNRPASKPTYTLSPAQLRRARII